MRALRVDIGHAPSAWRRGDQETKAPEGTATGATAGGLVGGTLGVLAIPGLRPFHRPGPIMAGLAGLGAGALCSAARTLLVLDLSNCEMGLDCDYCNDGVGGIQG